MSYDARLMKKIGIDIFSGAGGLTFGFYYNRENNTFVRNENCNIIFANEYDHAAAESFCINFPDINMINQDIKELTEEQVRALIGEEEVERRVAYEVSVSKIDLVEDEE